MAFNGHYEHTLDAKHRLSIPARFRNEFLGGIVLSKDTDACISVSTLDAHDTRVRSALTGHNTLSPEYKQIQRFFRGNAWEMELDSAGRITLPNKLREHAGIDKDVVVMGVDDHLELWSQEGWEAQETLLDQVIGEVTGSLGDPS